MVKVVCKNKSCEEVFTARQADINRGWGKYCSKSCKAQVQEKHTHQYSHYKVREQCRDEYGFTPVIFGKNGDMFDKHGSGVDKLGNPIFIGVADFDNTSCQNEGLYD